MHFPTKIFMAAMDPVRATPDSYTILVTPNGSTATNQHLMKKMPFDTHAELTPVATIVRWGAVLLANPRTSTATTLGELTARLKADPGKLNFGSGNFTGHAAAELYKIRARLSAVHVPYKSVPAAFTDPLGGQIDFLFADVVTGLP